MLVDQFNAGTEAGPTGKSLQLGEPDRSAFVTELTNQST